MTLLSLAQGAADLIGLPRPSSVVSSTDTQTRQLFAFANVEGRTLAKRHAWSGLIKEATFTTLAAELQGTLASIATDGFLYIVNDTVWNRTTQDRIDGPVNPQEWQALKASVVASPYQDYRIQGGSLYLIPAPAAGETGAFEYFSKNWCEDSGGTGQDAFAADDDVSRLDESIMTLGVVWRFKQAKNFDYAEDFRTYELQVADAILRDGGRKTLCFDEREYFDPRSIRAPDGNWSP